MHNLVLISSSTKSVFEQVRRAWAWGSSQSIHGKTKYSEKKLLSPADFVRLPTDKEMTSQ